MVTSTTPALASVMAAYEPFSCSDTTIIAAELEHRQCYVLELSPEYVDVAVLRWRTFTGKEAVLDPGGKTFAEVASDRDVPASAPEHETAA